MTEKDRAELAEACAIQLSHTALLTALVAQLEAKGLLDKNDVNEVLHTAMTGLETSVGYGASPELVRRARRVLENTGRNWLTRRK